MKTGIVILIAALSAKMMLTFGRQVVVLLASQAGDVAGYEAASGALTLVSGVNTVCTLALVVGCVMVAMERRAMPFGLGAAGLWLVGTGCQLLFYCLDGGNKLISGVWICSAAAALALTVAAAEAVRGDIRGIWVGAVGFVGLVLAGGAFALVQLPFVSEHYPLVRGMYILADLAWIGLLIAVVVVTLVPALSEPDTRR